MQELNYFDLLPAEILHMIAGDSEPAYRALVTAYPRFAREVTPGQRLDYMVGFGHDVHITNGMYGKIIKWTRNGLLHRTDGPALINYLKQPIQIRVEWYRDGMTHRDDGPACISYTGSGCYDVDWRRDGTIYSDMEISSDGSVPEHIRVDWTWYRYGQIHREDGPAAIRPDGSMYWYSHGHLHREGGPAITYPGGNREWYQHGWLHRTDGPAHIKADGTQIWYIHDHAHRTDGPAIIYPNGNCQWYRFGRLHRDDGPAVEYIHPIWLQEWYQFDTLHRDDGPAIVDANGRREWYLYGTKISKQ